MSGDRLRDIEERLKVVTPGRWRALTIAPDELAWLLRVTRAAVVQDLWLTNAAAAIRSLLGTGGGR